MFRSVYAVRAISLLAALPLTQLLLAEKLQAAPFQNLDFEQAQVVINDPMFGWLDAELATPGWQVSGSAVYYGTGHIGMVSMIMLGGPNSPAFNPKQLAGNYSLIMRGGTDPDMPSDASISQVGDVPASAKAIELLVEGDAPVLTLNGQIIDLIEVDNLGSLSRYAGDISSFAGTTAELSILYAQSTTWLPPTEFEGPVLASNAGVIDNLEFTTRVVPEPATWALAAAGTLGLAAFPRQAVRGNNRGQFAKTVSQDRRR